MEKKFNYDRKSNQIAKFEIEIDDSINNLAFFSEKSYV